MQIRIRCFILSFFLFFSFAGLAQQKPNIIYILADDLGYGDLGVMGQAKIETPNIDALAANGMLFNQFYAFPVCAPSRYLLLTGKHSGNAYIRGNDEWANRGDVWSFEAMAANPFLEGQRPIPDSTESLPKIFKQNGYTTGLIGKWGLGAPYTQGEPNNQGFDYFFGYNCQRMAHTYYPGHLWENQYRIPLRNSVQPAHIKFSSDKDSLDEANYAAYIQPDYAPDLMLDASLRFLESNKDNPFLLLFTTPLPHVALQAPQKWIHYYKNKFGDEQPYSGGNYAPSRYPRATYAAMVSTLDEQVGLLVDKLKQLGIYDNTIVIFTSDNGPSEAGGGDPVWFNSGGPFRADRGYGKGSLHEGGIRVPFIVQWPGKIKAGTKTSHISANWDVLSTLTDLAKITNTANADGVSFSETLMGNSAKQKQHPFLYWEFPESGGQQAVRLGKWKALRKNLHKGNTTWCLYNLETDFAESNDIASNHPDVIRQIENIAKQSHTTPALSQFLITVLE